MYLLHLKGLQFSIDKKFEILPLKSLLDLSNYFDFRKK